MRTRHALLTLLLLAGSAIASAGTIHVFADPGLPQVKPVLGELRAAVDGETLAVEPLDAPPFRGRILRGCPPDTIMAMGAADQKLFVVPSLDLVVVRLGDVARNTLLGRRGLRYSPEDFDNPFLARICRAVAGAGGRRGARSPTGGRSAPRILPSW